MLIFNENLSIYQPICFPLETNIMDEIIHTPPNVVTDFSDSKYLKYSF